MRQQKQFRPRIEPLENRLAPALVPVGPQFLVDTGYRSRVAADALGDFVIAYDNGYGPVKARRYNSQGVAQGTPLTVATSGWQPTVAVHPAGNFVVAWNANDTALFARRFNADGTPAGSQFTVSTVPMTRIFYTGSATDAAGNFVIAWSQLESTGARSYARTYDFSGAPISATVQVAANMFTGGVAMDADGDFVVTWQGQMRRFSLQGIPYSDPVPINGFALDVATVPDGRFVVTGIGSDGDGTGIFAQRFDSAGQPIGPEIPVNTHTTGQQGSYQEVRCDADGDFLIAWESRDGQDGSLGGIYAQMFKADGSYEGTEFRVNSTTLGDQSRPAVAMTASGDVIISWANDNGGVYAQRYRKIDAPRIDVAQVNSGSAQRSRVTDLAVTFNAQVTFAGPIASAFTLTRTGGGAVNFSAVASVVNSVTVVTLNNFTGPESEFGSLRDGRYTLTALASQISANGHQMAANYTFNFHRFYGDMNGDARVDISDFGFFSLAYLTPLNYNAALDFNNDGRIDIADFGQFSVRFFTTLP